MDETDILKERKERILAYMESEGYVPIKRRDMRAMLSVPQEDREKFESLINELIAEGRVFETKKGKLASPKDLQMATGTFIPTQEARIFLFRRAKRWARCRRTECCIRCCIRRKRAKRQMA